QVFVKGVGLGYFGEHSLAVVPSLRDFLPQVYGVRAGLMYRDWLPQGHRLDVVEPGTESAIATAAAVYVASRHRALAVKEDVSRRLFGQGTVWEVASNLL